MTRPRAMPKHSDAELDQFKRQINLTQFAATLGYAIDRKASSRNSAVMIHPAGDKLVVAKGEDGHFVYFSVRNPVDHGSIIDFIQRRQHGTLGEVRKELRQWAGGSIPEHVPRPAPDMFAVTLDHLRKDLVAVRVQYASMRSIETHHAYLEDERKIPWHILTDPLFADRIRVDAHNNAIFPHFNRDGLCGFEKKNHDYTGFASGAVKGLWCSRTGPEDQNLIIAETAIDALSYAALKGKPHSRYVSTAGSLSPDQPILLQLAIEKLPGGQVILAVDHDAGGDSIGARIEAIFALCNRPTVKLIYDRPATVDADWNDVLRGPTPSPTAGPVLRPRPPR